MFAFPLARIATPDDQRWRVSSQGLAHCGVGADEQRDPLEVEEAPYEQQHWEQLACRRVQEEAV